MGIIGDIMFADHNRYGGGAASLGGPAGDVLAATKKLIFGSAQDIITGEETTAAKQAAKIGKGLVPGQSLWYARLALERYVFDNVDKLADPQYAKTQRRKQRQMKTEQDQEYFWKPGKAKPRRAPKVPKPISSGMPRF